MPVSRPPDVAGRLAAAYAGRELLTRCVTILGPGGPRVMPVKGILLQRVVYRDAADRAVSDVDLICAPGTYRSAEQTLVAGGFESGQRAPDDSQVVLKLPGIAMTVDLHREPFASGAFGLTTADLFTRGHDDTTLFGVPVRIPSALDTFAHLVGHAAMTYLFERRVPNPRDFGETAAAFSLEPSTVARHLEATGLAAATRYLFAISPDDFGGRVVAALEPSIRDQLLARAVRRLGPKVKPHSIASNAAAGLLHRTPAEAGRVVSDAVVRRIRKRLGK